MKNVNKYVGLITIINVLVYFIYIVTILTIDIIIITDQLNWYIIKYIPYIISIINIVVGTICLFRKKIKAGIINILIALIYPISNIFNSYFDSNRNIIIVTIASFLVLFLSILNLVINNKNEKNNRKSTIICIIICSLFFIIEIIPISIGIINYNNNISNFEKMLDDFQNTENINGFKLVKYKDKDNSFETEFIYYDQEGKILNKYEVDEELLGRFVIERDNKEYSFELCIIDNNVVFINDNGDIIYKYNELITGKHTFNKCLLFLEEMLQKFGLDGGVKNNKNSVKRDANSLKKYDEKNYLNEENKESKYLYFKDDNISDDIILQIEITNNLVKNKCSWISHYTNKDENETNSIYNRNIEKVNKFYEYDKNYYLINTKNNSKIELQCENLLYDVYKAKDGEEIEEILLLSDCSIPFYDSETGGCFNIKNGEKTIIDSKKYILTDSSEKYNVLIDKETGESYFISKDNGTVKKKCYTLEIYNDFYLEYTEDDSFYVLDKDLNLIKEGKYLKSDIGRIVKYYGDTSIIAIRDDKIEYNYDIFKIKNSKMQLLETADFIRTSNDIIIPSIGENAYAYIGVIYYE